ncbi:MAG: hypothetical protein HYZ49_03785, partial [Chloroflexi bacterium]|nr:hypothetical protein [Chloroflexota bacterium]
HQDFAYYEERGAGHWWGKPALLPALEMLRYTARAALSYEEASRWSLPPLGLAGMISPLVFGRGARDFWPPWDRVEFGYMGLTTLAILLHLRKLRNWPFGIWLLGFGLFSLFIAFGKYTPAHFLLYKFIPGFASLRVPARFVLLTNFALAVLAGYALSKRLDASRSNWRFGIWLLGFGILSASLAPLVFGRQPAWAALFIPLAVLIAALILFQRAPRLLPLLLFLELFAFGGFVEVDRADPSAGYKHGPAVDYLLAQPGPTRIDLATSKWQPDAPAVFGLESITGLANPLALAYYDRYYWSVGYRGSPQYNFLNAQFVVADKDSPPADSTFVPVFNEDPDVDIYLNTNAMPRVHLIYDPVFVEDPAAAFAAIHADGFNPASQVVIEPSPNYLTTKPPNSPSNLFYTDYQPGHFTVVAQTPESAYLVMKPPQSLRSASNSLISNYQLLFILALAALLRLGWPGLTEFKADEARLLALALDMAEFKGLALRGIGSSVGFPNFPMSVWLYSIPLFLWKHPYSATFFLAGLNTLAVYVTYRLTRRYWGEAAALVATLFFAVSPWAVIYSRKIWAQNLLPLFVLLYIGSALAAFVDKRRHFLLLHFVSLAVVVQIHLSGLAFIPLTGLLLIIFWRRTREAWREIVLGLAAAALTAIPFGIWVLSHADDNNQLLITDLLSRPALLDFDSLRFTWLVLTGGDIHSLAGPKAFQDYLNSVPDITLIRWLWGGLAAAGLFTALRRRRPADLILALWLIVPVLFFIRHSTPVFPHYFILTLPAGYILAGDFVQAVNDFFTAKTQRPRRFFLFSLRPPAPLLFAGSRLRGSIIAGVIVISAVAQASAWLVLLFFIGSHNTPGGFGTPLGLLLNAVDGARQMQASLAAPEILVVGGGDDPAVDEFPAVMDALFRGTPHRFVDGNEAAVFPQGGAVAIIQPGEFRARGRYEDCAETEACMVLRDGELGIELVGLAANTEVAIANPFPEPRTLANGVELLGWESQPAWAVIWRVGYVPAATDYHFFNHAEGAQVDGAGYPSRYWLEDDLVISFFDLSAYGFPVRVGMYEYPSVVNVPVMDVAGEPFSDAVTARP